MQDSLLLNPLLYDVRKPEFELLEGLRQSGRTRTHLMVLREGHEPSTQLAGVPAITAQAICPNLVT